MTVKSTVSSACQQIKDEYAAWAQRPLDGISLDYLFLDATFFRMHPGGALRLRLAPGRHLAQRNTAHQAR